MRGKGGDGRELGRGDNRQPRPGGLGFAANQLRSYVERIESLEEEKRTLTDGIKEIRAEAKGSGFDTKVLTYLIRERRKNPGDVDEFNAILDTYKRALGELPGNEESL